MQYNECNAIQYNAMYCNTIPNKEIQLCNKCFSYVTVHIMIKNYIAKHLVKNISN